MKLLPKTKPKNHWLTSKTWKVMKLTSILVIALTLQVSAAASSQTITFSGKNVAFKKVLSVIKNQTNYVFFYDVEILKNVKPISLNVVNAPVEKVLEQAFSDTSIAWIIEGKTISIVPKAEMTNKTIHLAPVIKHIKGKVTDEKGEPLSSATILLKGTKKAVISDMDGNFTIELPDSKSILVVSFTGFITKEVAVDASVTSLTIQLEEENTTLKEVVIGYGKQKSAQVVSSISSIKGEQLQLPGRSLNNSLAGRVAGLYAIQRSGEPGYDNAEVYIRGLSSFAGGTRALILVDGVPRNMSDISTEEIETFTVLKDASATAVYGSEGANGVILITSKRGRNQKTTIDFKIDNSFNSPTRVMPFLGSADWMRLSNEAKWNTEGNPNLGSFVPFKTDAEIALYDGRDPDLYPNVNWMDMLKKVATNQKYSLNFRGGGDKMRFFVGTSYYNEEGAFLSNPTDFNEYNKSINYDVNIGLKRFNLRSNIDMDISETTKLNVDISSQYLTTNYPGTGTGTIFASMMRSAPHLVPMIYSNGYPSRYSTAGGFENPYTQLNFRGVTKEYRVALQTNIGLEQKFKSVPGLIWKIRTSFDADFTGIARKTRGPSEYIAKSRDANGNLIMTKLNMGQDTSTEATDGGFSGGNKKIYMETSLTYNKKLGEDHALSGLLLANQKESQIQGTPLPFRKQGVVGRLSYAYGNKYFMDGSFGFTGSENFAPDHQFGFFPAFGLGYLLTNEYGIGDVIKSAGIQTLKLRVSYGQTGNDQVSNTRWPFIEQRFNSGLTFNSGITATGASNTTQNLIFEGKQFNPNLRWEIEDKKNVGIDITAWDNALNFTVDYFDNLRHDILLQRNTIAQAAGLQQNPFQNFGKVSNKGIDASLSFDKKINSFSIGATGTFTFARNKILEMDEIPKAESYQNFTGTSIGTVDGYVAERLYTNDDFDITTSPTTGAKTYTLKAGLPESNFGAVYPGNIKYADLNEDGKLNTLDLTRHVPGAKTSNPEIVYGFGVNADYKGFYGNVFFQGVANVTASLDPGFMMPFTGNNPLTTSAKGFSLDRWTVDNPNPNALLPRLQLYNTNQSDIRRSSWFLRDGGFIRLKNAEIGYKLEKKQLELFGLTTARVYVLGTNLAVWDKIKYWDPEQGGTAGGAGYPIQRTINVGFDVTF